MAVFAGAFASHGGFSCGGAPLLPLHDAGPGSDFCNLPGSIVYTAGGPYLVAGGPEDLPDLSWLTVPEGFCVHHFGNVGNARQIRFAPGGELFVASPTTSTTGGGPGGQAAIVVLADDDGDGLADNPVTYLGGLPSTQGLLFTNGFLYYQDDTRIRRLAYQPGDRTAPGAGEEVVNIVAYKSNVHWPKTLDVADDGTIYVGNGGDQEEACTAARPFHGGIFAVDGTSGGAPIVKGLRNPIGLRCQRGHNRCFAAELALDYSGAEGGREKIIPIQAGDDWGFPCCASRDLPYGSLQPPPDCSQVAGEKNAFVIGDTPFGIEFEYGAWPTPWKGSAFVVLHGAFGSWVGARVVAIATDPVTGALVMSSNVSGTASGFKDFATGWDDGANDHGRPGSMAMSPDGRLFVASDATGDIVWIAPVGVAPPDAGASDASEAGP